MGKVIIQCFISPDTNEILESICNAEKVSKSSVISVLIDEFLDRKDIARIVHKAKQIKPGRPKKI
jgi:hypothetical protein